jgi:hypothetical protein
MCIHMIVTINMKFNLTICFKEKQVEINTLLLCVINKLSTQFICEVILCVIEFIHLDGMSNQAFCPSMQLHMCKSQGFIPYRKRFFSIP